MRTVVWIVFGVLAATWTVVALLGVELAQWLAQAVASGRAADLGQAAAQWPIPAWVGAWIDPALIAWIQDVVLWAIAALRDAGPAVGAAIGWVVPLIWLGWGLGFALLLLLAGGAHLLAGRARRRPA